MHKRYFLLICIIIFYTINTAGQLIKDKAAFTNALLNIFNNRTTGFDSIAVKNSKTGDGLTSKILLPGAEECYIKSGNYFAGYSFKDSIQAISFFKELQNLITEASIAYSAIARFTPEPDNPYYLHYYVGNDDGFYPNPDLITLSQHVLYKDYFLRVKGGIPYHGSDKLPVNPFKLYLIIAGQEQVVAFFTSKGERIVNNEITNLVKDVAFSKDTLMTLLKKNKKVTDEGNSYESKRTLKGYQARILEYEDDEVIHNHLQLTIKWKGKEEDVYKKTDSLILNFKAALPASYCYAVNRAQQSVFFYTHPFAKEKPGADITIKYGINEGVQNSYFVTFFIVREIEKVQVEEPEEVEEDELTPFKSPGGKYGYKNNAGEIIVPAKYDEASEFTEERGHVVLNNKHGFIDISGKELIPLKYDYASIFVTDGLTEVQLNYKYGMIDKAGKVVIPIQYDQIDRGNLYYNEKGSFHRRTKFILVKQNGKYGFVDSAGRVVVPLKYDNATIIENLVARVKINNKDGVIDHTGKVIVPIVYDAMNTDDYSKLGIIRVKQNNKWGLVDKSGKEIIAAKYDYTGNGFFDGLAWVRLNEKSGYVDKTGKEVIPLKYDRADNFSNGLAAVWLNRKCGYIDKTGKEIIAFKYENGGLFSHGMAPVKMNGKWGYIDKTGKTIIPFTYDDAEEFDKTGEAKVYLGKKWGKINTKGVVVKRIENEDRDDDW